MGKLKLSFPEFRHAPSVICGTGAIRVLADLDAAATAFFTSSKASINDIVSAALARTGRTLEPTNNVRKPPGEPTHESVREGAAFLSARPIRRLVVVGGGSVLDWARLAWAHSVGLLDLTTGVLLPVPHAMSRPELWLVPTTCATGAEAADVAVFTAASGSKVAAVSPAFVADKVVLDGRFLEAVSPIQLAAFLCDALSHAIEAALSLVPLQLGKEAALSAFRLITSHYGLPSGGSRNDRLMEASFLGGVAAANCSVGIVHAFAHSVGRDGLGHGLANACALRTGLEFNAETPQMRALLGWLGLDTPMALAQSISPIVERALTGIAEHPLAVRLQEPSYQQRVAAGMAGDVAVRSNPRRPSKDDLLGFVRAVAGEVAPR